MAKKKKKSASEYGFFHIKLIDFSACVDASINYEVRDNRHYKDDAKVFSFSSNLEVDGIFTYPEERAEAKLHLAIYGSNLRHSDFDLTLADCHIRDDHGSPKYRKVRGEEIAIYDIPKGVGRLERQRGTTNWLGNVWVSPQSVTDMLALLPNVQPLFLTIHEMRAERNHWIVGLTLQTKNPEDE